MERSETRARQVRITPPQRMLKPFAQSPRERIQKVGPTEYLAVRYKIPRAEDAGFVRLHGLCDQFALCSRLGSGCDRRLIERGNLPRPSGAPGTIASLPGNSFLKYEPVHSGRSPFGLIAPDIPAVDWKVDESEAWADDQWKSKI